MKKSKTAEEFFKPIEFSLIILILIGTFICLIFSKNIIWGLSYLCGGILGFLNFRSTKKEGITFARRVQQIFKLKMDGSIERERIAFLFKIYLKLFATGIVLYFFISKLHLHPFFILLAFFSIYFWLILISLKYFVINKITIEK